LLNLDELAAGGSANAMNVLGRMLEKGKIWLSEDYTKAATFYYLAAQRVSHTLHIHIKNITDSN
jgi:TPR repeat protein